MKQLVIISNLFLGITFAGMTAEAGVGSSGGGASVVCRDPLSKKVLSAELLDLYEGKIRFGFDIQYLMDANQSLQSGIDRIKNNSFTKALVKEYVVKAIKASQFLPEGVALQVGVDIGDGYAAVIKEGCGLEYAGYYEEDGSLKIVRSIYRALSETDKAAFYVHEAIYKIARDTSAEKNSAASRKLTAMLFAKNVSPQTIDTAGANLFFQVPAFDTDTVGAMPEKFAILQNTSGIIQINTSPKSNYSYELTVYCTDWDFETRVSKPVTFSGSGSAALELDDSDNCHRLEIYSTSGPAIDPTYGTRTPEPLPISILSNGTLSTTTDNNAGFGFMQVINLAKSSTLLSIPVLN